MALHVPFGKQVVGKRLIQSRNGSRNGKNLKQHYEMCKPTISQ